MPDKAAELWSELRLVLRGGGLLDTILPPVLFLLFNNLLGIEIAMAVALGVGLLITLLRLRRRQSLTYALAGFVSVGFAIGLAFFLGRAEGFFIPSIVNSVLTVVLAVVSLLIRRPMVAWTSFLTRRWPIDWYWHDKVRPAYSEVTIAWVLFFGLRLVWQINLFQGNDVDQLGLVTTLTGWPAIIILLLGSYLYGTRRLVSLAGPSVEEFRADAPPPWQSQRRGF